MLEYQINFVLCLKVIDIEDFFFFIGYPWKTWEKSELMILKVAILSQELNLWGDFFEPQRLEAEW